VICKSQVKSRFKTAKQYTKEFNYLVSPNLERYPYISRHFKPNQKSNQIKLQDSRRDLSKPKIKSHWF